MLRTTLLNPWHTAVNAVREKINLLSWQDLYLAIAGGIALAVVARFLGKALHSILPIPMSGSLAAALPRAIIFLIILLRTKRFGMLTIASITEVSAGLSVGLAGWWPMSMLVPLLSGIAGDLIWLNLKKIPSRRIALILTGGSICGVRMFIALFFWTILLRPIPKSPEYLTAIIAGIVMANIILGMLAGLSVDGFISRKKTNK